MAERESVGELLARQPPRILVAAAITVVGIVVLAAVALVGRPDGGDGTAGGGEAVVSDDAPADVPDAAPGGTAPPLPPDPVMVVEPDWYRKGSSVYAERQSAQTIPPGPGTSSTTTTTTTRTATSGATGSARAG